MKSSPMLYSIIVVGCCLFAFSIPFDFPLLNSGLNIPLLKSLVLLEIVLLVFLWETVIISERKLPQLNTHLAVPFLAFFILHIFSAVVPSEKMVWSLKYTFRFFGLGIIAFMVMNFIKTSKQLEWLVRSLLLGAALAAVFVFIQYYRPYLLTGVQLFFDDTSVSAHRIRGLFGWPTDMSVYFGTLLPLAISVLLNKPKAFRLERVMYAALICIFLICLLLSRTRGWIIGLFCGLETLSVLYLIKHKNYKILMLGIIAALIFTGLFLSGIFGIRSLIVNDLEPSEMFRFRQAVTAFEQIKAYPLRGIGADMFYWKMQPNIRVHNIFLETTVNLGVFGLAALLWMFGAIFGVIAKKIFKETDFKDSYIQMGAFASLASFLGHCQVDYFWNLAKIAGLFWVIVGIGFCSCLHERRE